jgi:hypothetical protein
MIFMCVYGFFATHGLSASVFDDLKKAKESFEKRSGHSGICSSYISAYDCLVGFGMANSLVDEGYFPSQKFSSVMIDSRFTPVRHDGLVSLKFDASKEEMAAFIDSQSHDFPDIAAAQEHFFSEKGIRLYCDATLSNTLCRTGVSRLSAIASNINFSRARYTSIRISDKFRSIDMNRMVELDGMASAKAIRSHLRNNM